jgi:hypothetical protein
LQRAARAGVAYILASAVCFGAMAIMARFAYASGVDTTTLLALRFGIAAGILVAVALARRKTWPRGKTLATLVVLGALGYGGQAFTFFTALALAPAGLVALPRTGAFHRRARVHRIAGGGAPRRDRRADAACRRRNDPRHSRASGARSAVGVVA